MREHESHGTPSLKTIQFKVDYRSKDHRKKFSGPGDLF